VRKNFNPAEDSHAGRELPSTAPTYIRNIQTGKSKKESKSPERAPGCQRKYPSQPHTYLRNTQKGKKEKKSWY
jgi:hypothetical protein